MRTEPAQRQARAYSKSELPADSEPSSCTRPRERDGVMLDQLVKRVVEMTSVTQLATMLEPEQISVHRAVGSWVIRPEFARLSNNVGLRSGWTDAGWRRHLANPRVRWLTLHLGTLTAGLAELVLHEDGRVEIAAYGLSPEFRGRGLGVAGLIMVSRAAWALCDGRGAPPTAVWTTVDQRAHPALLPTFLCCGYRPASPPQGSADRP